MSLWNIYPYPKNTRTRARALARVRTQTLIGDAKHRPLWNVYPYPKNTRARSRVRTRTLIGGSDGKDINWGWKWIEKSDPDLYPRRNPTWFEADGPMSDGLSYRPAEGFQIYFDYVLGLQRKVNRLLLIYAFFEGSMSFSFLICLNAVSLLAVWL